MIDYIPQNIGYKEIKNLNDVFEIYGYNQNDGSLFSIYSYNNFRSELDKNYKNIVNSNKKINIDYFNSFLKAAEKTFENFINNNEFFEIVKNEYAKLRINFPYVNPKTHEEEDYDLNSLNKLDHSYVKHLILQKLKGNLMELISNYYISDKVNPNGRINVNTGINLFNYFIDDYPDEAKYYIVNDKLDKGIDSIIVWFKNKKPIGALAIQIKYRTSGLKNLDVIKCVNKMTNVLGNSKIGRAINWEEKENSNYKYAIIINDVKEKIFDKKSKIWFENGEKNSLCAKLTNIFDLKFLTDKIFGYMNETTIKQIFAMLDDFNDYCK